MRQRLVAMNQDAEMKENERSQVIHKSEAAGFRGSCMLGLVDGFRSSRSSASASDGMTEAAELLDLA